MWKKVGKYAILIAGVFVIIGLMTLGGYTAVRTISGLAVAESRTIWNNLKDAAFGDNAINGIGAFGLYLFDGTNFDRARGDIANGLDVDVTRVSGTVTTTTSGTITPADNLTNPTNTINSNTLNSEFDGTTWDRVRHSFSQATTSITSNGAGTTIVMSTTPMSKHAMLIDRTAGATDAVEIDVECSINSASPIFVQIATIIDLANEPVYVSADGSPCGDLRFNVVDIGAGNTVTIHLLSIR